MPLVQAARSAPLQCGSVIISAPGSLAILEVEATEPPSCSSQHVSSHCFSDPLGIRLRSHLLLQELPGLYTQDIHTSEGASLFRELYLL